MKTLLALILSTSSAMAYPMACTPDTNKNVLAQLEKNANETLHFVGIQDGSEFPIEITVSDTGTWTMLMLVPDKTCFLATGSSFQSVEQKPKGVEN